VAAFFQYESPECEDCTQGLFVFGKGDKVLDHKSAWPYLWGLGWLEEACVVA